ncbi:MAG: choice-of-anchor J domain-containing protein [candidate division WOR-3 bacterium]|nr:choice-of-anchor J domain-containing protein [candidate division WOR-3 bacterium]
MSRYKFCLIILLLGFVLFSQQLNESFTDAIFPPEGWRFINNDGYGTQSWTRSTLNYNSEPACAGCLFDNFSLTSDDWLITPRLLGSVGDTLKFFYRAFASSALESLEVRLSLKGARVSDFTKVLWGRRFNNTTYGLIKISLHNYVDSTFYIAFRYYTPLGDIRNGIYLDDISGPTIYTAHDVGVSQILAPIGVNFDSVVYPSARVKNFGSAQETIPVVFKINSSYEKSDTVILFAGLDTVINFPACTLNSGTYNTIAYTKLINDDNRFNDTCYSSFIIRPTNVWQILKPFPKVVKTTGSSICFDTISDGLLFKKRSFDSDKPEISNGLFFNLRDFDLDKTESDIGLIYCLIAGDTSFYVYDINLNDWLQKKGLPVKPKTGLGLVSGNNDTLYALLGNKKKFYKYSVSGNNWQPAESLPLKPKSYTALYSQNGFIYALIGDTIFLRFVIASDTWENIKGIPAKIKNGAALTGDTLGYLYALRGSTKEFYRYSIASNKWSTIDSVPVKVKKGAGLACDGYNVYCLASGKTKKFYKYNPIDKWQEMDSLPFKITGGSTITYAQGKVYCLAGSRTNYFYRYIPEIEKTKETTTNSNNINFYSGIQHLETKSLSGYSMFIYDKLGRLIQKLNDNYNASNILSKKSLPCGIYFLVVRDSSQHKNYVKKLLILN